MSGHREAAIALHGVSTADQEAILASLPEQDQGILRAYLQELRTLGFDASSVVLDADMGSADGAGNAENAPDSADPNKTQIQHLRRMSATCMYEVLAHEPASLIAQLLTIESWPWAAAMLEMFPPAKRNLIMDGYDNAHNLAQARVQFLLQECGSAARRVARTMQAARQEAQPVSPWRSLLQKVTAWTR